MSWLPTLPSFEAAAEALNKIGGELGELTNKVQDALPIDSDLIGKLTLRSDELVKEHELLDAQEKRKELVREYLSEILPWETKDETREILVDECRAAILNLSKEQSTFETPFRLQRGKMFNSTGLSEEEINFENELDPSQVDASSLKLERMQPLPLLLDYFDIDTHVGLIERLLQVDENLVQMHSILSGAGEKETLFWKNYFFHCAFTRYEKGLSVDEIWSQKPKASITDEMTSVAAKATEASLHDIMEDDNSVELDFEEQDANKSEAEQLQIASQSKNTSSPTSGDSLSIGAPESSNIPDSTQSDSSGSGTSYEIVEESDNIEEQNIDDLDALEAEIARELGEY